MQERLQGLYSNSEINDLDMWQKQQQKSAFMDLEKAYGWVD